MAYVRLEESLSDKIKVVSLKQVSCEQQHLQINVDHSVVEL